VFIPTVSEGKIKFVQHPFLIHFSHLYPHIWEVVCFSPHLLTYFCLHG
jgi:hypothetical protein